MVLVTLLPLLHFACMVPSRNEQWRLLLNMFRVCGCSYVCMCLGNISLTLPLCWWSQLLLIQRKLFPICQRNKFFLHTLIHEATRELKHHPLWQCPSLFTSSALNSVPISKQFQFFQPVPQYLQSCHTAGFFLCGYVGFLSPSRLFLISYTTVYSQQHY